MINITMIVMLVQTRQNLNVYSIKNRSYAVETLLEKVLEEIGQGNVV